MASVYRKLFGFVKEEHTDLSIRITLLRDEIRKEIIRKFKKNLNKDEINELFKCVIKSLEQLHLLSVYNIHSGEDFDVVIKKAVFKAKNKLKYLPFLLKWTKIYRHLNNLLSDGILYQDLHLEVFATQRLSSDLDHDDNSFMARQMEDEMDGSGEESDLEVDEYFEQLKREDEMDSSDEES
ncbi:uncharacterized protein LOC115229221 [Octopus sinensis]|uniref:Uncharacterized protein LOC115229221 n=1 Tax=Octopus sinensis TaxID=2607531 RepID=A0A6P7U1Q8_9MOLL|nr:uncharacterized protein LOC115229221 [Octopus sinensis]